MQSIKTMGINCKLFSFISAIFRLSIIITNKKRTATAPTYITKKINGRYSTSKSNKIDDIMQKDRIKNRTEKIGFFEKTTIKLEMKQSETRIKKVTL